MLSACASAPAGQTGSGYSPLLSSETRPPAAQPCALTSRPANLPDPDLLIDRAAVEAMPRFVGETDTPAYIVIELSYDSIGDLQAPRIVEGNLNDADSQRVLDALAPRVANGESQRWSALLRIDGGPNPALRVGRTEYCSCALLNRADIDRLINRLVTSIKDRTTGGVKHELVVLVKSDSLGNILDKRLDQISVNQEVNLLAVRIINELEIVPPRLNRRSIDAWSRLPITVSFNRWPRREGE